MSEAAEPSKPKDSRPAAPQWLVYLRLFRLPNVFTAVADVVMGYLFVHQGIAHPIPFLCLLAASCLMYTAGMVLNDVYDIEADRRERPQRPLPSGRIGYRWATGLGYGMLLVGWAAAAASGYLHSAGAAAPWRGAAVGGLLAICVVAYDAILKKTPAAPLAMGGCRFFNVLLGMSFAVDAPQPLLLGYGGHHLLVAGGIGVYIAGVTWFARTEARQSSKLLLGWGATVMLLGVCMLGVFPDLAPAGFPRRLQPPAIWPALLAILLLPLLRRCGAAIHNPAPQRVQAAVKQGIFTLIVLDAAVVMQTNEPLWAVAVAALLVPSLLLDRLVYST